MRSGFLLIVFGFIVMAVCTTATGQIPPGKESGIEGIITVSPAKPGPTRIDAAGSVPLANATFVVANNNAEIASFTTDEKGHFRAALPPGHYKVSLKGRKTIIWALRPLRCRCYAGEDDKRSMGV